MLAGVTAILLFGLVVAIETLGPVTGFDVIVARWMSELRTPTGLAAARVITWLGSVPGVIITAFAGAFVLIRRVLRLLESLILLTSVVVGSSLMYVLKLAVSRQRPPTAFALGEAFNDYSFPSGHTTIGTAVLLLAAVLMATTVARTFIRRLIVGGGIATGTFIGLSRVYLGYHWGTDIIGGWLLAVTVSAAAMAILAAMDVRRV